MTIGSSTARYIIRMTAPNLKPLSREQLKCRHILKTSGAKFEHYTALGGVSYFEHLRGD